VVTDSVFSMDGDVAPLAALRRLCDAHDVGLLVDEAHGTGVLGPTGRGGCEAAGVTADVLIGTLSKALGSFGAYVAGSAALYDLVLNRARSLVFSTALPAAVCAASEAAVALLQRSPELRAKLGRNVQHFAAGLRAVLPKGAEAPAVWLGAGEATWETTIFSVVLGSPERALDAAARLRDAGVLVKAIRPPTVPEGTSRLRFAVTAAHEPVQLSFTLEALSAVLKPSTVSRSTSPSPRTNANPNPTPAFPS
jgi:8-amino-7-oxononanoate synthase